MQNKIPSRWKKLAMILAGTFLYALGMNEFIIPYNLYSGGGVGIAQIITIFLGNIPVLKGVNLYGIVYMMINIPLLWLAWRSMGKRFFIKTLIGAGGISFFMSVLPVASQPVVQECITSVMIGGVITGIGIGIVLVAGGCGGGVDIIAVWAARKYQNASVGKISMAVNAVVYAILFFMFDMQVVIYSVLNMVFFTLIMDKVHYQNIAVRLMIFTKKEGIEKRILEETGRGVTAWKGVGAYTHEDTRIMICCINKYEINEFMEIIHSIDQHAFVIVDEGVYVAGNFEKRI